MEVNSLCFNVDGLQEEPSGSGIGAEATPDLLHPHHKIQFQRFANEHPN